MQETKHLTDVELRETVHQIIVRELGPVALLRYLRGSTHGRGDYTAERRELLKDVTMEEILEGIEDLERKRASDTEG